MKYPFAKYGNVTFKAINTIKNEKEKKKKKKTENHSPVK